MEATAIPTLNKNGNIDLTKQERAQSAIMLAVFIFIITCFVSIGYLDNTTPNAFSHAFVLSMVSYLWTYAVITEQTVAEWEFNHPLEFTKHEQIIYDALLLVRDVTTATTYKYKKSHSERCDYEKSLHMSGILTQATTASTEPVLVTLVTEKNNSVDVLSSVAWLIFWGYLFFLFA